MYGTNVESDSTMVMPEVGIVDNCTLVSVSIPEGKEMLSFEFRQPNGATVKHTEFPANPEYGDVHTQATDTSRRVKHIATKVMPEEHFVINDVSSFLDYAHKVVTLFPKTEAKFRMLFIYKGKYVNLPTYPNFIESMAVPEDESTITISSYNQTKLTKPAPDNGATNGQVTNGQTTSDDLPF